MTPSGPLRSKAPVWTLLALVGAAGLLWALLAVRTRDALVVYCAHDLMYAEEILRDFERQTGISIALVGDTEATKSLGLVKRLIRERENPLCDVFWNNQMLGTVDLAGDGVLEPYRGRHWSDIPERFRDDDGLWTGFGARMRVWIYGEDGGPPPFLSFSERDFDRSLSQVVIAQPMFGTTLSHYAVLWHQLGGDGLSNWHRRAVAGGLRVVPGNATVKDLVAEGVCSLGMTDTDDFYQAVDAGSAVAMQPIRTPAGETICLPNTVAIIRGTARRSEAERLVDYLTSPEVEIKLARSKARQIPLGKNVSRSDLPEDVRRLAEWSNESVDLKGLDTARDECLEWLVTEFAP